MTLSDALAVLDATGSPLETHLLQIQIVATLSSRTFGVLAAVVVHVARLVRLIDCEALTTVLLIGGVLQIFTP